MQITKETIDILIDKYNELWRTDIRAKSRERELVIARQCFFYVLRTQYRLSYTKIGDIFDKNHASVIHGERLVRDMLEIGDRDTENKLKSIIDLFRLYSIDITSYISEKNEMMENLENMLKSLRIMDRVDAKDIKRLVDSVWKTTPDKVA